MRGQNYYSIVMRNDNYFQLCESTWVNKSDVHAKRAGSVDFLALVVTKWMMSDSSARFIEVYFQSVLPPSFAHSNLACAPLPLKRDEYGD